VQTFTALVRYGYEENLSEKRQRQEREAKNNFKFPALQWPPDTKYILVSVYVRDVDLFVHAMYWISHAMSRNDRV